MPRAVIDRTGEKKIMRCGLEATIIAYRGRYDMDIRFENGTIRKNVLYKDFDIGNIGIDPKTRKQGKLLGKNHLGESKLNKYGDRMIIVEYHSYSRLVVRFDNGDEVVSTYQNFEKGSIVNPTYKKDHPYFWAGRRTVKNRVVGEKHIANNGLIFFIDGYENAFDVNVLFETGHRKEHIPMQSIRKGQVGHPFPFEVGNFTVTKPAYTFHNEGNFYCKCKKCGLSDIMSIKEMKKHQCEE